MKTKRIILWNRNSTGIPLWIILFFLILSSCKNDLSKVHENRTFENTPDLIIKAPHILRSISGKIDVIIDAKEAERFFNGNVRTVFPKGVFVTFFNENEQIKSTLSAKYAVSLEKENRIEARNNVIIIDYQKGDTIYTEEVLWDQNKGLIYSEQEVKSINGVNVIYGEGFELDEKTNIIKIIKPKGDREYNE